MNMTKASNPNSSVARTPGATRSHTAGTRVFANSGFAAIDDASGVAVGELARTLASWQPGTCASVFFDIGGLEPVSAQVERQVRSRLHAVSDPSERDALVASLATIERSLSAVPRGTIGSIAVFLTAEHAAWIGLDAPVGDAVEIFDGPDLLPVLATWLPDLEYRVLCLDQHGARLFGGTRHRVHPIEAPTLTEGFDEVLWYVRREPMLNASASGVIHGTESVADEHKEDVRRYMSIIAKRVATAMANGSAPLVLAGVDYEVAAFRAASSHRHIVATSLPRQAPDVSLDHLRDKAWAQVEPLACSVAHDEAARFAERYGSGLAIDAAAEIVDEIASGSVASVLVSDAVLQPTAGAAAVGAGAGADAARGADSLRPAMVRAVNAAVRAGIAVHIAAAADLPDGVTIGAVKRY